MSDRATPSPLAGANTLVAAPPSPSHFVGPSLSREGRGVVIAPSPLAGEGWGEGAAGTPVAAPPSRVLESVAP